MYRATYNLKVLPFITVTSTAFLLQRKPATARTSTDSCSAQNSDKRSTAKCAVITIT
jgi:hypothetical protein